MSKFFNRLFVGPENLTQCAALPYRWRSAQVEIALITSRGSGRWIIPKGWPQPGLAPWEAAANEAFEEAGLTGEVDSRSIGSFRYLKRLHFLASSVCEVAVFPLSVEMEHAKWPECRERERAWFAVREAATAIEEADLRELIYNFAASNR